MGSTRRSLEPFKTEVWAARSKNRAVVRTKPFPDSLYFYVTWRVPLYGEWPEYTRVCHPIDLEKVAWETYYLESNLGSSSAIQQLAPSSIPSALVRQFLDSTQLTIREVKIIERQALKLWGSQKYKGEIHPTLEKVANGMALWEKMGVNLIGDLNELPVKEGREILQCLSSYAEVMKIQMQQERLRRQAVAEAGIQQYVKH